MDPPTAVLAALLVGRLLAPTVDRSAALPAAELAILVTGRVGAALTDGQVEGTIDWVRIAAIVLAVVLVAAAVAKARRPADTAADFAELGLVAPAALARIVPALELGCAVALVVAPAWGGIAAFALLAGFTAVLVGVVRSGRVVRCNCFGQVGAAPVSSRTLVRNAILLALAAIAATGG